MGKPESYIEDYLVSQAKKRNIWQCKFTAPSVAGVPDRLCIANNKTIFIETKAPKKVPRALQVEIINEMIDHGAYVYVADSREKIDELFNGLLLGKLPKPKKLKK